MTYFKNTNLVWFSADLAMCPFELTEIEIRDYFTKVFYNNKIDGEHAKQKRVVRKSAKEKGIPENSKITNKI